MNDAEFIQLCNDLRRCADMHDPKFKGMCEPERTTAVIRKALPLLIELRFPTKKELP